MTCLIMGIVTHFSCGSQVAELQQETQERYMQKSLKGLWLQIIVASA